jgi:hypothetical protein
MGANLNMCAHWKTIKQINACNLKPKKNQRGTAILLMDCPRQEKDTHQRD